MTRPVTHVTDRGPLRLKDAYLFFTPLVLMVELNMISKSAIHAFLARTETPSITLAAFNAAFTLYYAVTSATELIAVLCLSYVKSRADIFRLLGFVSLVLLIPVLLIASVGFTSVGDTVFGDWFGLGARAQSQAREACLLLLLSMPVLLLRGVAFAMLMLNRRTLVITWSTLIRLLSLGLSLVFLPQWLDGAAIGAGALVFCMFAETVFAWCMVWPNVKALPRSRKTRDSVWGYWRFSWPLMINSQPKWAWSSPSTSCSGAWTRQKSRLQRLALRTASCPCCWGPCAICCRRPRPWSRGARTYA